MERRNSCQASILTAFLNGIDLIQKSDSHLLLVFLKQSFCLSKLNFHKFKHNFRDTVNPMCPTNDGIEDTEQFLLLCPSFDNQRQDLLAGVSELLRPFVQIETLPNNVTTFLLNTYYMVMKNFQMTLTELYWNIL